MENLDSTSELQSRLSSLSVSSFPGISSKNCEANPLDKLQSTDLSQAVVPPAGQIKMDDNSNTTGQQQRAEVEQEESPELAEGGEVDKNGSEEKTQTPGERKALPMLLPPSTWSSPALRELKARLRQEPDSVVTVYRGDIMTVNVPTVPEARRVCWEFATDAYDIGFGIYFDWSPVTSHTITVHVSESSDDEDEEDEVEGPVVPGDVEKGSKSASGSSLGEVLPVYRQDSHISAQGGSHEFPGEGTYLIKFDNSYSLWRNKTLYYRVYYSA